MPEASTAALSRSGNSSSYSFCYYTILHHTNSTAGIPSFRNHLILLLA